MGNPTKKPPLQISHNQPTRLNSTLGQLIDIYLLQIGRLCVRPIPEFIEWDNSGSGIIWDNFWDEPGLDWDCESIDDGAEDLQQLGYPVEGAVLQKGFKNAIKNKKYEGENVIFEPCLEYKLQENVVDSFADEPFKFKISEFIGVVYEDQGWVRVGFRNAENFKMKPGQKISKPGIRPGKFSNPEPGFSG